MRAREANKDRKDRKGRKEHGRQRRRGAKKLWVCERLDESSVPAIQRGDGTLSLNTASIQGLRVVPCQKIAGTPSRSPPTTHITVLYCTHEEVSSREAMPWDNRIYRLELWLPCRRRARREELCLNNMRRRLPRLCRPHPTDNLTRLDWHEESTWVGKTPHQDATVAFYWIVSSFRLIPCHVLPGHAAIPPIRVPVVVGRL